MLSYDKMLFNIKPEQHDAKSLREILYAHPEIRFVSLAGLDLGGQNTDEKIPVERFIEDMEKFIEQGVQTDGSSVVLPIIAELNNAKVDIIPDTKANWYVDHNFDFTHEPTGLPVGTLRIPCFLVHNDTSQVGSRVILRDAIAKFEKKLLELIKENPYVTKYLPIDSPDDIERVMLTCATELEFWVKTPQEKGDREALSIAQVMKEQYWKRTVGPVRTALEETLILLEQYGFEMEMGHKEVGGVKARFENSGKYNHIMEQLEIDWKYSNPIQACDNERHIRDIVRDVFRHHGLEVTFRAKPIEGVAGSGKHVHIGACAKLKDGRKISLFSPKDTKSAYLNPIGFGALLGMLKNYEVLNPFITATNDAFNRLKPGYEAPICIVTSIGHTKELPSRNRTVLICLIREETNPLSTRFELRSPNPKSNTYLVIATSCLAMLDGIEKALKAQKTPDELLESLSKQHGVEDFYLETEREYRSERNVFEEFTPAERDKYFGFAPRTVWENLEAFDKYPEKTKVILDDDVIPKIALESYKKAVLDQWSGELGHRIVNNNRKYIRNCTKLHDDHNAYDDEAFALVDKLRNYIAKDSNGTKSLLSRITAALDEKDYALASALQLEMQEKMATLTELYINYKRNIF